VGFGALDSCDSIRPEFGRADYSPPANRLKIHKYRIGGRLYRESVLAPVYMPALSIPVGVPRGIARGIYYSSAAPFAASSGI
jgi:hypothetical protein